jgi:sugar lactone lactonase YvrE
VHLDLNQITFLGNRLNRPECVIAHPSGLVLVSDWTAPGGIAAILADGTVRRHLARNAPFPLRPNGIALADGGEVLLAHLGDTEGGVWRLFPDGTVRPELLEVDGAPLPPTNFVHLDQARRMWTTVSTRTTPRADAYRKDIADGFIVLTRNGRSRIVADGLGYTNEAVVHPDGETLYVNETFARRLTTFDIAADGSLSERRTIAEFGPGTFPDGLTFDAQGGVWVTSIVSNRIIHVAPDGSQTIVLEDCDHAHLDDVETAFQSGCMGRPHLDRAVSKRLMNVSSLAFAGPDLKTIILGCLLGDRLSTLSSPVAGWPMPHHDADISPLTEALNAQEPTA